MEPELTHGGYDEGAIETDPANDKSVPATPKAVVPLLAYQRRDIESNARFQWSCWARQTGKSFTKSLRRILRGLQRGRSQILLSAGERQSRELMEKVQQHCQALGIAMDYFAPKFFRRSERRCLQITLPRGVRVIALPANPQTARGFTGDVFLDEFAMHADDRAIWAAMFPTILRGEGELDVASTPKGKNNFFYQLRDNDRFATSVVNIHDANAQGLGADIEALREAMGDEVLFRQEFLCEFVDEATAFLTYDQITACADPLLTLHETPAGLAKETRDMFVGVDIGRVRDLTVVWVLGLTGTALQTVGLFELSAAPFREQFDLICEVIDNRCVRRCCIDAGGLGMQLAEQACERFGGHRVEAVTFTPALKSQIAGGLRIAVEGKRIRIPNDERIRNDWHSVERTVTESGHFRLAAPRREGSHADRFWAAALAVYAADLGSDVVESLKGSALRFARPGTW